MAQGLAISMSAVAPEPSRTESTSLMFIVVGMLVLAALASQFIFERVLARAATKAVRQLFAKCAEYPIQLGRMRVWVFLGRVELRNCTMRNPAGYKSDQLLHVRQMSMDFSTWRCLHALVTGEIPEIQKVQVTGVSLIVEASDRSGSNLQQVIAQLSDANASAKKPSLSVKKVSIIDVNKVEVGATGRTVVPNLEYMDFSKDEAVNSADRALLVVLKVLEEGVVAR